MKRLLLLFLLLLLLPFHFVNAAPEVNPEVVQLLIPKLNSDRIEYFFGSYGVEQIQISPSPFNEGRISNLYSHDGDKKIMRTLAIVDFKKPVHERLQAVHKNICEGQSVGIALRLDGWMIDKTPLYFGSISLSPQLKAWMNEKSYNQAAIHIYNLNVFKETHDDRFLYCTIIEVHSPQYLDKKWLKALYPDQYKVFRKSSSEVAELIEAVNSLINAFP